MAVVGEVGGVPSGDVAAGAAGAEGGSAVAGVSCSLHCSWYGGREGGRGKNVAVGYGWLLSCARGTFPSHMEEIVIENGKGRGDEGERVEVFIFSLRYEN